MNNSTEAPAHSWPSWWPPSARPPQAATRPIEVVYHLDAVFGETMYNVRFTGTVSSNGPTGYVIDGNFDGYCHHGALTHQSATTCPSTSTSRGLAGHWRRLTHPREAPPPQADGQVMLCRVSVTLMPKRSSGGAPSALHRVTCDSTASQSRSEPPCRTSHAGPSW